MVFLDLMLDTAIHNIVIALVFTVCYTCLLNFSCIVDHRVNRLYFEEEQEILRGNKPVKSAFLAAITHFHRVE